MNVADDSATLALAWAVRLEGPIASGAEPLPADPAAALAALAAEALGRDRGLLLVTPDDQLLPDISNALDLNLRPLCLVLPAASYAGRIALRATLSLLKSRLTRAGEDSAGPAWLRQQRRLEEEAEGWRAALAWGGRGLDTEAWPAELARLFPVRILPASLAREFAVEGDWIVLADAGRLPAAFSDTVPEGARVLRLEERRAIVGALVPADENARLRGELDLLTQELAELELELATAQAEVADFTRRYHELVGRRLADLDDLHAELARRRAEAAVDDMEILREAQSARARADQSRREQQRYAEAERERTDEKPFTPTQDLKKLFRQLAQKIHPDRAVSEADRAWRTQLMSEANRAYRAGDERALREVASLWREGARPERPGRVAADGLAAQVAQLKRRVAEIEGELNRLFGSKLYELFTAANIARRTGRDLLQEMADRLDGEIAQAQARIRSLAPS